MGGRRWKANGKQGKVLRYVVLIKGFEGCFFDKVIQCKKLQIHKSNGEPMEESLVLKIPETT
jgi:hypothetical protein